MQHFNLRFQPASNFLTRLLKPTLLCFQIIPACFMKSVILASAVMLPLHQSVDICRTCESSCQSELNLCLTSDGDLESSSNVGYSIEFFLVVAYAFVSTIVNAIVAYRARRLRQTEEFFRQPRFSNEDVFRTLERTAPGSATTSKLLRNTTSLNQPLEEEGQSVWKNKPNFN